MSKLSFWEKEGIIKEFIIAPDPQDMLKFHWFMKKNLNLLRDYDFNFWLTRSEMQVEDKYIMECVLSKNCIRVAIWPLLTYFLQRNQSLARSLLNNSDIIKYCQNIESKIVNDGLSKTIKESSDNGKQFLRLLNLIKSLKSLSDLFQKINSLIFNYLRPLIKKYYNRLKRFNNKIFIVRRNTKRIVRLFFDRTLFPFLMDGKRFTFGPYDEMTQMGSGHKMDAYIFSDEIEVEIHKRLFRTKNVYFAQYPSTGYCTCDTIETRKMNILSPLSLFVGSKTIPDKLLQLYYRDFRSAIYQSNATNIDLRLHPDETGEWPYQLRDYLNNRGIVCKVVEPETSIVEIVCNYLGVMGQASAALRDCRASCKNAFIIGLAGISKQVFSDPKFVFGKSEGISWINDDGSFNPIIFQPHQYVPVAKKSIVDIVMELSGNER